MGNQQQQEAGLFSPASLNLGMWVVGIGATVARVFVNSGMGTRGLGLEGFFAFIALPVIATAARSDAIVNFWYAWSVLAIFRRITADRRERTNFVGRAPFSWLIGHRLARIIEPFIVLLIAYGLSAWSEPLASLIAFSALCMAIQGSLSREIDKRRREAIHDARIDAGFFN